MASVPTIKMFRQTDVVMLGEVSRQEALTEVLGKRTFSDFSLVQSSAGSLLPGMAEREGFEPSVEILSLRRFSKPLPSATRPPLRARLCAGLRCMCDVHVSNVLIGYRECICALSTSHSRDVATSRNVSFLTCTQRTGSAWCANPWVCSSTGRHVFEPGPVGRRRRRCCGPKYTASCQVL